jgi:hypothetical protein
VNVELTEVKVPLTGPQSARAGDAAPARRATTELVASRLRTSVPRLPTELPTIWPLTLNGHNAPRAMPDIIPSASRPSISGSARAPEDVILAGCGFSAPE